MDKILITLLMGTVAVFASSNGAEAEASTDIVARTVNFLIFAGIIWYLLAEPVKNYFNGRSKGIADELDKVQVKLRESTEAKEKAVLHVEEAKKTALEIKEGAEKEKKVLHDRVMVQCDADLVNIEKQNVDLMDMEQRKAIRGVVNEVMDDVLAQAGETLDKETMAQIIMKKVA